MALLGEPPQRHEPTDLTLWGRVEILNTSDAKQRCSSAPSPSVHAWPTSTPSSQPNPFRPAAGLLLGIIQVVDGLAVVDGDLDRIAGPAATSAYAVMRFLSPPDFLDRFTAFVPDATTPA